jgi:uncharacterized protein (DUF2062 family)
MSQKTFTPKTYNISQIMLRISVEHCDRRNWIHTYAGTRILINNPITLVGIYVITHTVATYTMKCLHNGALHIREKLLKSINLDKVRQLVNTFK